MTMKILNNNMYNRFSKPFIISFYLIFTSNMVVMTMITNQMDQIPLNLLMEKTSTISSQAKFVQIPEIIQPMKTSESLKKKNLELLRHLDQFSFDGKIVSSSYNSGGNSNSMNDEKIFLKNKSSQRYKRSTSTKLRSTIATTLLPILTTQQNSNLFEFIPVNIVETRKEQLFLGQDNEKKNSNLGDISLVPSGSNTKVQIKKGPNGKDYEYEYIYYYYDEDIETDKNIPKLEFKNNEKLSMKSASIDSNMNFFLTENNTNKKLQMVPTKIELTVNKVERKNLMEKELQKQLFQDKIPQENFSTYNHYPLRTLETKKDDTKKNVNSSQESRKKSSFDQVESSISHILEGPEFPQSLPNGPIRFLGVTPNEANDDKLINQESHNQSIRAQDSKFFENEYNSSRYIQNYPETTQNNESKTKKKEDYLQYFPTIDNESFKNTQVNQSENVQDFLDNEKTNISLSINSSSSRYQSMEKLAYDLYIFSQHRQSNVLEKSYTDDMYSYHHDTNFSINETERNKYLSENKTIAMNLISSTTNIPLTMINETKTNRSINGLVTKKPSFMTMLSTHVTSTKNPSIIKTSNNQNKFRYSEPNQSVRFRSKIKETVVTTPKEILINITDLTLKSQNNVTRVSSIKRSKPFFEIQKSTTAQNRQFPKETLGQYLSTNRMRLRNSHLRNDSLTKSTEIDSRQINQLSTSSTEKSVVQRSTVTNKLQGNLRRRNNQPNNLTLVNIKSEDIQPTTTSTTVYQKRLNDQRIKQSTVEGRIKILNKSISKNAFDKFNVSLKQKLGLTPTLSAVDIIESTTSTFQMNINAVSQFSADDTKVMPIESEVQSMFINNHNKLRHRNRFSIPSKLVLRKNLSTATVQPLHFTSRRKALADTDSELTNSTKLDIWSDQITTNISEKYQSTEASSLFLSNISHVRTKEQKVERNPFFLSRKKINLVSKNATG